MWNKVKDLRPIRYSQTDFQPESQKDYIKNEMAKAAEEAAKDPTAEPRVISTTPLFVNDDTERWGFIAHELQETLLPSAASGEKDSYDTIQCPNPMTVIAALTRALQEAMARIEILETKVGLNGNPRCWRSLSSPTTSWCSTVQVEWTGVGWPFSRSSKLLSRQTGDIMTGQPSCC